MSLPSEIRLGYRTLRVLRMPLISMGAKVGEYQSHADTIVVAEGLSPVDELHTLIHELVHAVWATRCLREGDDEERIVGALSEGVLELLMRNPDLLLRIGEVSDAG
jgi:hypothetical protein